MILSGNTLLLGQPMQAAASALELVFKIGTDARGYTNLHSFTALFWPQLHQQRRSFAAGQIDFIGNTLYGTTFAAFRGCGTDVRRHTDGTGSRTCIFFGGSDGRGPEAAPD